VGIGASTGGPGALCQLLRAVGGDPPLGVVVVQHIADGFEVALADWLDQELGLDVALAADGEELAPGRIRIAPAGRHLVIDSNARLRLDAETAARNGHRPSVDVLFESMADLSTERVAAVLLSGMGSDGVSGIGTLRERGALTIAQNEATSAVFGMPGAALDRGAVDFALAPEDIGRLLVRVAHGDGS